MTKKIYWLISVLIAMLLVPNIIAISWSLSGSVSGEVASPQPQSSDNDASSWEYYLPMISNGVWKQLDKGAIQTGALSLAICPSNAEVRYLGTVNGLFSWSKDKNLWEQVYQTNGSNNPVPGSVWDVVTDDNCSEIYAAALENGLWQVDGDKVTQIDDDDEADIPPVGSVVIRDGLLFAGTDEGVHIFEVDDEKWRPTIVKELITRQSMAGDRVYVAAWTFGVKYNDSCPSETQCWEDNKAPDKFVFIRDVLGSTADETPGWVLAATSAGIVYWDGSNWLEPVDKPTPAGNVFALAQSQNGQSVFAAVEGGGIWASADRGANWYKLGELNFTTRDLTVAGDILYAVTTNNGVWQWSLNQVYK